MMSAQGFGDLTLLLAIPVIGAAVLVFLPRRQSAGLFSFALLASAVAFLWSLKILDRFDGTNGEMQLVERVAWMPAFGIQYILGIDGISIFLVLLTTFLMPIALLASWSVRDKVKEYLIFMLLLGNRHAWRVLSARSGAVLCFLGSDAGADVFLNRCVGRRAAHLRGGEIRPVHHGRQFAHAGRDYLSGHTPRPGHPGADLRCLATLYLHLPVEQQTWLFLAFALSFAIKVPLFPFHTWLPDAHVEAPTAGSVILAGVLLKLGTYGFLRFAMPLFPDAAIALMPDLVALSVIGIIYGAVVAMMQSDIKKLVAYSSVSHLGFVMLGLFALNMQGVQGGIYQMLSHGLSTGALFLMVGMIYDRRHTRMIEEFGGLWKQMPVFSALLLVVTFSSIGLPGLNGFVGEFLILLGSFSVTPRWTAVAATGVILGAIYMLWMFRRVIFGPLNNPENQKLQDLNCREWVILAPIIFLILFMGVYPQPFLSRMQPAVDVNLKRIFTMPVMPVAAQSGVSAEQKNDGR